MTAIFGHVSANLVFLAADTRRRNHGTGALTQVTKLHKWSDELIIAQGGAGAGAADAVLAALRALSPRPTGADDIINAISVLSPPIIAAAKLTWAASDKTIPPTQFVLGSADPIAGCGLIQAVDLGTGNVSMRVDKLNSPYMSGSDTPAVIAAVSQQFHSALPMGTGALPWDLLAIKSVAALECTHAQDIGLPVDLGRVRYQPIRKRSRGSIHRLTLQSARRRRFTIQV